MSLLHSVVLAILQGIAEFFPISSSAHLRIFPWLLGWDDFGNNENLRQAFDVALHLGTAIALLVHFRKEIFSLIKGAATSKGDTPNPWEFILKIFIATIPAGLAGVFLFDNSSEAIWVIAALLILFGLILGIVDMFVPFQKNLDKFSIKDAVLFGLVQAVALVPGVSRSGIIISAARLKGFSRSAAVDISFWMAIPILLGAAVYKFIDIGGVSGIPSNMRPAFLLGILVSAVVGYIALKGLVELVKKFSLAPLVLERILLGSLALILLSTSFR